MSMVGIRRQRMLLGIALLGCTTFGAGCGGETLPKRAPVAGRVVYRGQPVKHATVCFMRGGAARWSIGTTNDNGEFTLTTYEAGDGAMLGENAVSVTEGTDAAEAPPGPPDPEGCRECGRDRTSRARGSFRIRPPTAVGRGRVASRCA